MKRNLTTIATIMVMIFTMSFSASAKINPLKNYSNTKIIETYIESSVLGNAMYSKHMLSDDFKYENTANKAVYTKKDYLKFMSENKNITYNCKTTFEILDQGKDITIAKVVLTFENFTRVDYLTLGNTKDGLKINKVVTTYP